ncbi:DUF6078 family protein [uncultured Bacteroides sp.]|uniref:DUF6078 family protein n=1 Tax=uncultured Bacteroides sp. TaxID=162156 RepID=UPI002AA7174E|nr:DUF6078 family protein [uncultured Bacteroides sp.]
MNNDFDYNSVPYGYAHCFNNQCPKANSCMHHLAALHVMPNSPYITIVNPTCIPADATTCPYFHLSQKIHVAWGISRLLDNVPYKDACNLRKQLLAHFGKNLYYRFYRKERYIKPEDQAFIQQLFRQKGITEEPLFDSYSEEYSW